MALLLKLSIMNSAFTQSSVGIMREEVLTVVPSYRRNYCVLVIIFGFAVCLENAEKAQ